MSAAPIWEPDGTESPAERTDPLLPVITDSGLPRAEPPHVPALDDRRLAGLLAELDGDLEGLEAVLPGYVPTGKPRVVTPTPRLADEPEPAQTDTAAPAQTDTAAPDTAPTTAPGPKPAPGPLPTDLDPATGAGTGTAAVAEAVAVSKLTPVSPLTPTGQAEAHRPGTRTGPSARGRYVRREYQPPPPSTDALSLTGLTRRAGGRTGEILFTVLFLAVFLLIVVQAIVSLIRPAG